MSQVRVYIAPGTTSIGVGDKDMFNKMATDNMAKQLSCSWGWNPDDTSSDDPIFQEFAAQGQNMFVASGDAGAYTGIERNRQQLSGGVCLRRGGRRNRLDHEWSGRFVGIGDGVAR